MYGIRMLEQVGTWWKERKEFLALFTELWGTYNGPQAGRMPRELKRG